MCSECWLHNEKYHWQAFYRWPSGMSLLAHRVERPTNKPELLQLIYIIKCFLKHNEVVLSWRVFSGLDSVSSRSFTVYTFIFTIYCLFSFVSILILLLLYQLQTFIPLYCNNSGLLVGRSTRCANRDIPLGQR